VDWPQDDHHGIAAYAKGGGVTFAYRPAAHRWARLASGPSPLTLEGDDSAVWTGKQMLVLGPPTLGAYNPATNTWRSIPVGGPNEGAVVAWTGHEAIVWGGVCCDGTSNQGLAYHPATNSWTRLAASPLRTRRSPMGAWTGRELIVAGGISGSPGSPHTAVLKDAAAYNPSTNKWRRLPPMPQPRAFGQVIWDGKEVVFLGGRAVFNSTKLVRQGLAYNPVTNRWRLLPAMRFARFGFAEAWTGHVILVWGGAGSMGSSPAILANGEAYNPVANRWTMLPKSPLRGRELATAVWTGHQFIIWGGIDPRQQTSSVMFTNGAAFRLAL
jgi:hypothetical protein